MSTYAVGQALGTVIDFTQLYPRHRISTVQALRPQAAQGIGPSKYSGHFGVGAFPVHTDLAHWILPPRYLVLRCIVGSDDVHTNIMSWEPLIARLGVDTLRKAVFCGRSDPGTSGLVRAISHHRGSEILRWDSVFLKPLNQNAHLLTDLMTDPRSYGSLIKVLLESPGDTLIIDNWRMLHGRSEVPSHSMMRYIERVYLSELFL